MSGLRERLAEALYLANGFAWYGRDLGDWSDPESRVARGERHRWLGQADTLLPLIAAERDEAARQALREAADEIERLMICCPDGAIKDHHHICRWGIAARSLVLDRAALTEAHDE